MERATTGWTTPSRSKWWITRVAAGVANLRAQGGMARITVKVHPRAKRSGDHRQARGRLEAGSGGAAGGRQGQRGVRALLRGTGRRAAGAVRIVTGATRRMKVVEIEGMEQSELKSSDSATWASRSIVGPFQAGGPLLQRVQPAESRLRQDSRPHPAIAKQLHRKQRQIRHISNQQHAEQNQVHGQGPR